MKHFERHFSKKYYFPLCMGHPVVVFCAVFALIKSCFCRDSLQLLQFFCSLVCPFIMSHNIKFLNYRNSLLTSEGFALARNEKVSVTPALLKSCQKILTRKFK